MMRMKCIMKIFLLISGTVLFLANSVFADSELTITRLNGGNSAIIGDVLEFRVEINTHGDDVTGAAFFLTINSDYLEPVYNNGMPFVHGNFLKTGYANFNDTHLDSLHNPDNANGIPGFQLDYYQSTGPAIGGERISNRGVGVLATFRLRVVGLTPGANVPAMIEFNYSQANNRETGYYVKDAPGSRQRFRPTPTDFEVYLSGIKIEPVIPDTLIVPGNPFNWEMNNYLLGDPTRGAYLWAYETIQAVTDVQAQFNGSILQINSANTSNGILKLKLIASQQGTAYADTQMVAIALNHNPEFVANLPQVVFDEDSSVTMAKSAFFTDIDNSYSEITLSAVSDNIFTANTSDSITFSAAANWYGKGQVMFEIRDPIQRIFGDSVKAGVQVTVNSINDSLSLDLSALNPTLLYHGQPKTIQMIDSYVKDPDDNTFQWTVTTSDAARLKAEFIGAQLHLEALDNNFKGDVTVNITASDSEFDDSDSFTVSISQTPVDLLDFPPIKLFEGQTKVIEYNQYVTYPANALDDLDWTFKVVDKVTGLVDSRVTVQIFSFAGRVTIKAVSGHEAEDVLKIKVKAGVDNEDSTTTSLTIYPFNKLKVSDLPPVIMMQGTTRDIFDLDDYVVDPLYDADKITWHYSGGEKLQNITINSMVHNVSLSADNVFLGKDTLCFIAQNPDGKKDSSTVEVTCVPLDPSPIFLTPLPDKELFWKSVDPVDYVDLDDYIWDYKSPDSELSWTISFDNTFLDVAIYSENKVKMYARSIAGTKEVIFTAADPEGNTRSDTILVTVNKPGAPSWSLIPSIEFKNSEIFSDLYLRDFCIAEQSGSIVYSAEGNDGKLNIQINNLTSQVIITPLNGYHGAADIFFTAASEGVSSQSNLIHMTIEDNSTLSYFFNPVVPRWIDFVISSDPSAVKLSGIFFSGSLADTLSFTKIDSNSYQKVWKTTYRTSGSTLFKVICKLDFPNGMQTKDSLSISFQEADNPGGVLSTPDGMISIEYAAAQSGGQIMVSQKSQVLENNEAGFAKKGNVYTIQTRGFDQDDLVTVNARDRNSRYYSFYVSKNQQFIPMETYVDQRGNFSAMLPAKVSFIFAPSQEAAVLSAPHTGEIACYPNPFNLTVKIEFFLQKNAGISLKIYNVLGKTVYERNLRGLEPGRQIITWNGRDMQERVVPSGMYIVRVKSIGGHSNLKKIVLVK